jgi:hypothetical protein
MNTFKVFALGALMDLTLPECNSEAEGYYRLELHQSYCFARETNFPFY